MAKARRGRNEGSVFQRKSDGLWIARVAARDERGNPTRRQLGARKTKGEAQQLLNGYRLDAGATTTRNSVGEFLTRWLRDVAAARLDAGAFDDYRRQITAHVVPALGKIALTRLDAQRIATFYATLAASGLGAATRRRVHSILRTALETAVDWNLIPANPVARVDPPAYEAPERPTLDVARARLLLDLIAADRLAGVYVVAISMGLRQGEIFGMQWRDIEIDTPCAKCAGRGCRRCGDVGFVGVLTLRHNLQDNRGHLRLKGLKRRRQRRQLPIPPAAVRALRDRRDAARTERADTVGGYVFTSTAGTPLYKSNFHRRSWVKVRAQLGLPPGVTLHFHDLRHTLGQLQRLLGADLETRREQLGHASVRTTSEIYGHVIPEQLVAAARAVDELLRPAAPSLAAQGTVAGTVLPFRPPARAGKMRRKPRRYAVFVGQRAREQPG